MENIPCVIAYPSAKRIAKTTLSGRVTKTALKAHLGLADDDAPPIEFISRSHFHRYGAWFTVPEVLNTYGPCHLEVRDDDRMLVGVVTILADGKVRVS